MKKIKEFFQSTVEVSVWELTVLCLCFAVDIAATIIIALRR